MLSFRHPFVRANPITAPQAAACEPTPILQKPAIQATVNYRQDMAHVDYNLHPLEMQKFDHYVVCVIDGVRFHVH